MAEGEKKMTRKATIRAVNCATKKGYKSNVNLLQPKGGDVAVRPTGMKGTK